MAVDFTTVAWLKSVRRRCYGPNNASANADDTSFLLHRYPEAISDDDLTRIDQLIDLIGLNDLEVIMQDDDILNRFDLTHIAVSLVENVLRMRRERGGG